MHSIEQIKIIDPEDIADDAFVVSGGIMGSVKTLEEMNIEDLLNRWEDYFELRKAADIMQKYRNKRIDYVVPFEVGGLNTPVILSLAARMGISTIDGDALGRSAPETQMTSFLAYGVSLTSMPLADAFGNTIVVTGQKDSFFADEIGRWMITRGGGMGANNHYPMQGDTLKATVIPRTITKAIDIGNSLLWARQQHKDPVEAVLNSLAAYKLFRGRVSKIEGENKGGFYITNVTLAGEKDFAGQEAKLVIKNETMTLWINDRLRVVFPDLVCMLETGSGAGIMSVDIEKGQEMTLVGTPCHPRLREGLKSDLGSAAFSGNRYGHPEIKYVSIEELQES